MNVSSPERLARVLKEEGISPEQFEEMVKHASVYSKSDRGNRRYHNWVLDIQDGVCQSMSKLQIVQIGNGKTPMYEDCSQCDGDGCHFCGWIGEVKRFL